jgi:hypothetical protein
MEIRAYSVHFVDAAGEPRLDALNKQFTTPEEAILWTAGKCQTKLSKPIEHFVDLLERDEVVGFRLFYGMIVIVVHVRAKTLDVTDLNNEMVQKCHDLFMNPVEYES